jgi:hypothetical protein
MTSVRLLCIVATACILLNVGAQSAAPNTQHRVHVGDTHICEFRVGNSVPPGLSYLRERKTPTEGDARIYREYVACNAQVPVSVEVQDQRVVSIWIHEANVCIDGRLCMGDTLAKARREFPGGRVFLSRVEGDTLSFVVGPNVTAVFDASGIADHCFVTPSTCEVQLGRRRVKGILIHNF